LNDLGGMLWFFEEMLQVFIGVLVECILVGLLYKETSLPFPSFLFIHVMKD
jgi:hypothetical protein